MKPKIILLIFTVACFAQLWAKSEVKQPDSYAYTRGVEAYTEGNYADAMDWFNKELSDHPENGYAYVYVSAIRYGNDEYGKALSAVENALKRLPKKDKVWRSLTFASRAEIFVAMGDTIQALDDLAQAIKINPDNAEFYKNRGQLNYELGNYALADADYQRMIGIDPGDVYGYMGIGRNAIAQERWDDAIAQFDYAIKLSPDYSNGYSFRAEAYIGQEKWAEAIDDLIKAQDIDGDYKAYYLMHNMPKDALDLLKSKLKIQATKAPSNRYWPYCMGVVLQNNEEYADAISFYEKAHAIDANSVFLENISKCYVKLRDYAKALDYADRALAMDPDDYDVIELRADILSHLGRYGECIMERDRYVARYPEYALSYFSRAEDLLSAKRYAEAIEDYNTAVVLIPSLTESSYLLMKRGDAYRLCGRLEEAAKDYEKLLEVERDSTLTSDSWTPFAYTGLGNEQKAIEAMQFILDSDTTDLCGTLYNAACVYARLGKADQALAYLRRAVEKGYDDFQHIAVDYDLDCLRELPQYQDILNLNNTVPGVDGDAQDAEDEYSVEVVEVPFTKEGGVTKVKCAINGLPLHFVFDTGAADVTISMVEANFMLKNDYIVPTDIIGSAYYMDANGDITEGTVVNLRNVNFGGLDLENVRASVVRNQKAPLLLGQSVLGRLGKIEIDNSDMKLVITHKVRK